MINEHYKLVQDFTTAVIDNLDLIKANNAVMEKMNKLLDNAAALAQQTMKKAKQADIDQEYISRMQNIYSLSSLILFLLFSLKKDIFQ